MSNSTQLRELLSSGETLVMPDAYDPISIAAGQSYNIREFTVQDLREQRVARVSLPTLAIMSAIHGLTASISLISESDGFNRIVEDGLCCSPNELPALLERQGHPPASAITSHTDDVRVIRK